MGCGAAESMNAVTWSLLGLQFMIEIKLQIAKNDTIMFVTTPSVSSGFPDNPVHYPVPSKERAIWNGRDSGLIQDSVIQWGVI